MNTKQNVFTLQSVTFMKMQTLQRLAAVSPAFVDDYGVIELNKPRFKSIATIKALINSHLSTHLTIYPFIGELINFVVHLP